VGDFELLVPNFGWVLPGALAGSGLPGRGLGVKAAPAYGLIREAGVDFVLSLLETPPPWALLERAGLTGAHFPIPDHGTPADPAAFAACVDDVHARIAAGQVALVHCFAGIGRTGLFLAAYLARHEGLSADEAVAELRRLRPRSIETPAQLRALAAVVQARVRVT
jgi:protein-tyrosine phosphatase